jgi:hypothetical protein
VRASDGRGQNTAGGHAIALYGSGGRVTFVASQPARFLILPGAEIRESVVVQGSFIMNKEAQIEDAVARYRPGEMGYLAPFSKSRRSFGAFEETLASDWIARWLPWPRML